MNRRIGPTRERADRFARDWNLGLETSALREKYACNHPGAYAASLRRRGYVLTFRRAFARVGA